MSSAVVNRPCPNAQCAMWGKVGKGNRVLHGFLRLKRGRRRRYRCEACGRTFVSSVGTPYHRLHGQVMKTYRKNRVTKLERDLSIGSDWQMEEALSCSEDSDRLNTAFVERLNLTIRQGSAYLQRRSPAHARLQEPPADQLKLLRCYYNFVRPHGGLRFGTEVRTRAMQAGLVDRKLSFRNVFTAVAGFVSLVVALIGVRWRRQELTHRFVAA